MKNIAGLAACVALSAMLPLSAQTEGSFDRSLTVSGPVELDAKTDSGGITVAPGQGNTVHIHAILKAQHGWFGSGDVESRIREIERNPPVQQDGNRVRIGYVRNDLLRNISMHLEIQTPSDTKVHAQADSGGISVDGMRAAVDCKTDSGGIELHDIQSDVRAEADSGGIRIRDVKGSVFARVDSGGIQAENVAGSVDAEADSGHVSITQTTAASIRAKADSGGVDVRLAPNAGYDIDAETESGGISAPALAVRTVYSRRHVEGKLRGGGPAVNIRVDSGGIVIH
jgi:hypothetical protein